MCEKWNAPDLFIRQRQLLSLCDSLDFDLREQVCSNEEKYYDAEIIIPDKWSAKVSDVKMFASLLFPLTSHRGSVRSFDRWVPARLICVLPNSPIAGSVYWNKFISQSPARQIRNYDSLLRCLSRGQGSQLPNWLISERPIKRPWLTKWSDQKVRSLTFK